MPSYPDIYSRIRHYLQKSAAELPDNNPSLVLETDDIVTLLLAKGPCIGSYAALSGADKIWFDTAAGKLAAASLRPVLLSNANGGQGPIKSEAIGPVSTTYAGPSSGNDGEESLEDRWRREAWEDFDKIACIQAARVSRRMKNPLPSLYALGDTRSSPRTKGC